MFRYASFNRPLWNGFDPGLPFKIVDITDSDNINGRKPHDVIETTDRISPGHIYNLELTDYEEVSFKNKLIEYAQTKLTGSYLSQMMLNIKYGKVTGIDKIDFYANKANEIIAKIEARKVKS